METTGALSYAIGLRNVVGHVSYTAKARAILILSGFRPSKPPGGDDDTAAMLDRL